MRFAFANEGPEPPEAKRVQDCDAAAAEYWNLSDLNFEVNSIRDWQCGGRKVKLNSNSDGIYGWPDSGYLVLTSL